MPAATSVVTPARFEQGLAYADFLAQSVVNRDRFEFYYENNPVSEEDLSFFKKAAASPHGPAKILAIAEAWCGDVYRELPTVVRIAEATGMNLRIFIRDQNPDIMNEFLSHDGKARAIPVFVFYSSDLQYITHFTERPASANAEISSILDQVKSQLNLPATATFSDLPQAEKQQVIDRILPRFEDWQRDSIKEMRELLSNALKLANG
jgi:hypothetical protein